MAVQKLAIGALAILVLAACAAARVPGPAPAGPLVLHVSAGRTVAMAGLIDATHGWALTGHRLAYTADQGKTWSNITPSVPAATIRSVSFLSPQDGWALAIPEPRSPGSIGSRLFATTDAGRTWLAKPLAVTISGFGLGPASLTFVDQLHGWIVLDQGSHGGRSLADLYRTLDGGASWVRSTAPQSAPVTFIAPRLGYSGGGPSALDTFVTHDGGMSWSPLRGLAVPAPYKYVVTDIPIKTNQTDLVLPVGFSDDTRLVVAMGTYASHDDGRSWQLNGIMPDPNGQSSRPHGIGIIDSGSWLVTLPESALRLTRDHGQTWQPANVAFAGSTDEMVFRSPAVGWAVVREAGCLNGKSDCSSTSSLFQTLDGGLDWRELTGP